LHGTNKSTSKFVTRKNEDEFEEAKLEEGDYAIDSADINLNMK
jgi:hypothetical protein